MGSVVCSSAAPRRPALLAPGSLVESRRGTAHSVARWARAERCTPLLSPRPDPPARRQVRVCELAAEWRQTWGSDAIIDLIGYRRWV